MLWRAQLFLSILLLFEAALDWVVCYEIIEIIHGRQPRQLVHQIAASIELTPTNRTTNR